MVPLRLGTNVLASQTFLEKATKYQVMVSAGKLYSEEYAQNLLELACVGMSRSNREMPDHFGRQLRISAEDFRSFTALQREEVVSS